MNKDFSKIINHLVTQGFFYPNSQIYGGLANTWDYGPLGVEIKHNLKTLWWTFFVRNKINVIGLDSTIISNPKVWKASGHLDNFQDPLIDCKNCKKRYRWDELVELQAPALASEINTLDSEDIIAKGNIVCPVCTKQDFTSVRFFNLMFKTQNGVLKDEKHALYLRPETTQGIFVNFKNILRSSRQTLPFGVAQMGKSFRNEITPNNFIFRTREFEQMEIAFFCKPDTAPKWFNYWIELISTFLSTLKLDKKNLQTYEHDKKELAHYSKRTIDFKYNFPFGWQELWGVANRQNFDLKKHSEESQETLIFLDTIKHEKYYPYVIEPSVGVERLLLAILCDAYYEETLPDDSKRIILKLAWTLSPYQIVIVPLSKQLHNEAWKIYKKLLPIFRVSYDKTGSIGKRYRRADAIGVNYVITYDFDSEKDQSVTIRHRDTMEQVRVKIDDLVSYFMNNCKDNPF